MKGDARRAAFDVVVLGGGPAGAATAIGLKRRDATLRVALVEKSDYSAVRVGETLPPPAQRLLSDLGAWDAFLRESPLESAGTRAAWGGPVLHDNEFIFSTYGRGWHVDRRTFDRMLVTVAERAGVAVLRETRYPADLRASDLGARFVVDATGRRSLFARERGARHVRVDNLVGVAMFFGVGGAAPPPDSYTTIEACENGWWYTATLPGGEMAALFMTDAGLLRRLRWRTVEEWLGLSRQAPYTAARVHGAAPVGVPTVYPASSQRLDRCAGDGWLAAGDAASTFDPLSSQGVMKALRSGVTASLAVCQHLAGRPDALTTYARRVAREFDHYVERRAAYYDVEQRWPRSPFWQRRHAGSRASSHTPLLTAYAT